MSGAFDQRNFVLVRVNEASGSGTGGGSHFVHKNVVGSGGVQRAEHCEVEKLLDSFDGGPRRQGHTSGIEKDLVEEAGEILTGLVIQLDLRCRHAGIGVLLRRVRGHGRVLSQRDRSKLDSDMRW